MSLTLRLHSNWQTKSYRIYDKPWTRSLLLAYESQMVYLG